MVRLFIFVMFALMLTGFFVPAQAATDHHNEAKKTEAPETSEKTEDTKVKAEKEDDEEQPKKVVTPRKIPSANLVEIIISDPDFSTFVTALKASGLFDALKGQKQFTVFVPTNDAFAALPAGTFNAWMEPENKLKLADVLNHHILSGKIMEANIEKGPSALETLAGGKLDILKSAAGISIDEANVVKEDIEARDGVIHVLDKVLMP